MRRVLAAHRAVFLGLFPVLLPGCAPTESREHPLALRAAIITRLCCGRYGPKVSMSER